MGFQQVLQKLKEEISGRKDELTQLDSRDFTNLRYDQIIVRNSISVYISYLLLATGLIVFLLMPNEEGIVNIVQLFGSNWFGATLLALLPVSLFYLSLRSFLDRTPKLTVDTNGIKTNEWSLDWAEIEETKFRHLAGKTTLLILKTRTDEKVIDIGNTNVTARFLGHHVELLKERAVIGQINKAGTSSSHFKNASTR